MRNRKKGLKKSKQIHLRYCKWQNFVLFVAEQQSIVYTYHIIFNHSSISGHSCGFHILAIVNDAAMNTGVHVCFQVSVSLSLSVQQEWDYGIIYLFCFFVFRGTYILFPIGCPNLHSHQRCPRVPSSSHPCHSDKCEVMSHWSFDLHLSDDQSC